MNVTITIDGSNQSFRSETFHKIKFKTGNVKPSRQCQYGLISFFFVSNEKHGLIRGGVGHNTIILINIKHSKFETFNLTYDTSIGVSGDKADVVSCRGPGYHL